MKLVADLQILDTPIYIFYILELIWNFELLNFMG